MEHHRSHRINVLGLRLLDHAQPVGLLMLQHPLDALLALETAVCELQGAQAPQHTTVHSQRVTADPSIQLACSCGSISSGQRAVVVTMAPFSMLSPSEGRPSVAH